MRKRSALWAVWLPAAALLWLFENNAATLSVLAVSVLLPLFSLLAARRSAKRARLTLSVREPDAPQVLLRAEGLSPFSRLSGRLVCENGLSRERAERALSLAPGLSGRAETALSAASEHCGTLRLRAELCAEDLFGLWRSAPLACGDEFVTAEPELFLPRVALTENTTVITDGERWSGTRPGSDPSETFAVREYVPGDPIRQIHWKLSQKAGALLIRELGLPVVNRTLLVFRNTRGEGEDVSPACADAMARVFLSLSHALVNDGCAHTLAFAQGGQYALTEVRSEAEFRAAEARLLSAVWEPEDGALARLLAETPYAHVGVVSAAMPPDAERFCRGNRVTVLSPDARTAPPGVFSVPFPVGGCADALQLVEL